MSRNAAALGSIVFFLAVPCIVAGAVPWWISRWEIQAPFLGLGVFRVIGGVLIAAGVTGLAGSFARFTLQGLGTPAPAAPPEKLVVTGPYRYVRNPMYVAVLAVILGQALLCGDWRLIVYGAAVWLAFHGFTAGYEEPHLEKTFGEQYRAFRAGVPRWIPRLTPWRER